jgi:DNA-directed RNA polymerase specialized sigma24 family protein
MTGRIDDLVDARLLRWAEWLASGDGSGYARVNVLSAEWMPPTPGMTPVLKVRRGGSEAAQTHQAVGRLSLRLRNAVVLHYVLRAGTAEHAARAGCAHGTVAGRLTAARRQLWAELAPAEPPAAPAGAREGGRA